MSAATGPRVRLGWAIVLLLVAALEFTPAYQGALAPAVLVPAVVVPFALVLLGVRIGAGATAGALVAIVAAAVAGWFALHGGGGPLGGVGDALPRLLTTPRPAPAEAALLAPPGVLVALVSALVAAIVLAPASGGHVAGLLAPVVGSAAVYAAAQALTAGRADPHGIVAACLVVVVVAGWSQPVLRGGALGVAWRPAAVVPAVVAAVVGLGAATLVPSTSAFDPRRHVTPPTVRLTAASPLSQLGSWTVNPGVEIFSVRAQGTNRMRLATLSRFSGAAWEVDDHFREVGLAAPVQLPPADRVRPVAATVRISRLGSIWLPAIGFTTATSYDGAVVDADDGTLAHTGALRPGATYELHGRVDAPTTGELAAAPTPVTPPARYLALPGAPNGFLTYARAAIRGASTPLEEAVALEHAVSTGRKVSATAPTGSSYARLQTFLFGRPGTRGAQAGSAEQFAAGFAVLAREVGLPTRLVVGFTVPRAGADGTAVVHGRDATAWPEVYLAGAGWVPFAPTPGAGGGGAEGSLRDSVLRRVSDRAEKQPVVPPVGPGRTTPTPRPASAPPAATAASGPGLSTAALAGIAAGAFVVAVLVALVALRRLRTARHRRQGARGAWAEFVDLLVLLGRRPVRADTAPALAAAFDAAYPDAAGTEAGRLAAAADRAAFAPDPASSAPDVWRDLRVLRRRARGAATVRRRVLMPLDPRPLVRRR